MSLEPVIMGTMKTTPTDIPKATEPVEVLMARDLAAWQLAKAAIAKAMGGSGK